MANTVKTLPRIAILTTPQPLSTIPGAGGVHHWALSVSVQSDPGNTGIIYVGDNLVTTTRYSRALKPGDWYTVEGSAVDPSRVYVVGTVTTDFAYPSWN